MSQKTLKTGKKEVFDNWIGSIINDLNLRSNDFYNVKNLKAWDWKKLWKIFNEYIDLNDLTKEKLTALEEASELGRSVILKAYGKSDTDFILEESMDHYLNSPNYD